MIILIAGMHAVGKTFLSRPLALQLGLRHAIASTLISEERGVRTWSKGKSVDEVEENQHALIRAVSALRNHGSHILLDGHLVLRGKNDKAVLIPAAVYRELGVGAIVLLEAPTEVLLKRLKGRDHASWNAKVVNELIHAERTHALSVANELGIALKVLHAPTPDEFRLCILEILPK